MNNYTIKNGDAMSGNEPNGARRRRTKTIGFLGVTGICAVGAAVVPIGGTGQAAPLPTSHGIVCDWGTPVTGGRAWTITATDGYTSEPDGNAIYDWSYTANGGFQLPGPVLCANQNDIIQVTLNNNLAVATSIQFPGQSAVTSGGLPVGPVTDISGNLLSLVPEAAAGGTVDYSFTAASAGTYVYQSGSDPQLQVQMGLFGALVVYPNVVPITGADVKAIEVDGGPTGVTTNGALGMSDGEADAAALEASCAYAIPGTTTCDPSAIYEADRENILMLSEVDPGLHSFMELNKGNAAKLTWNAYPGAYEAHYFMINGRSMPDTVAPNGAPWLPTQPYSALASVEPWDVHVNPLDAMLRYIGVGQAGYDFHPHSNHENVIATDGALMKSVTGDFTEEKFNILVGVGGTVDATFRWTNEEGYADSNGDRVPVQWPQGPNLLEGDFWSGSPYLGNTTGKLNPGIQGKTQCGEYYHVAHNHDLTQVTNYGITFGGMLTLIKVEPLGTSGDPTSACSE